MKELINFIKEIDSNNSQNFKVDKLQEILRFAKYEKFVRYVYGDTNFYVTEDVFKGSTYSLEPEKETITTLDEMTQFLEKLSRRELTFREYEYIVCFEMNDETRDLFFKCLNHNLFVGVSNKVLEKAWKEMGNRDTFLPIYPYMRCSLMEKIKHIKYPAISQVKMDGTYANIIFTIDKDKDVMVDIYSRQGKRMDMSDTLRNRLQDYARKYIHPLTDFSERSWVKLVFMGEALVRGTDGKPLDRKTGNGLITSLSKRFDTARSYQEKLDKKFSQKIMDEYNNKTNEWDETERNIYFVLWDCMPYDVWQGKEDPQDYETRFASLSFIEFETLKDSLNKNSVDNLFEIVESKEVNSYEEAYEHFLEMYKSGQEGTILKNMDLGWKNGTSNHQIKFKAVKECELKVTGYEMGSGKYSEGIGALLCESSDGLLKVSISGMTESERGLERVDIMDASKGLKVIDDFDFNKYTGKIITVEFNELIKAKDKEDYSLFLPRIKEFREDKSEADDLEYIKGL